MPDDYDCRRCGACCISNWDAEAYVYVDDVDIARLQGSYTKRTVKRLIACADDPLERGLGTKTNKQGHIVCVGLRGSVGKQCSCRLYETRPRACQQFKPGSLACKGAREDVGLS